MAVQKVIKMGHPLLFQRASKVENFNTPELDKLIIDMKDTMDELNGAGLAAPQIAVSLQIMIFGITENPRYPDIEPVPVIIKRVNLLNVKPLDFMRESFNMSLII